MRAVLIEAIIAAIIGIVIIVQRKNERENERFRQLRKEREEKEKVQRELKKQKYAGNAFVQKIIEEEVENFIATLGAKFAGFYGIKRGPYDQFVNYWHHYTIRCNEVCGRSLQSYGYPNLDREDQVLMCEVICNGIVSGLKKYCETHKIDKDYDIDIHIPKGYPHVNFDHEAVGSVEYHAKNGNYKGLNEW